MIKKLNAVFLFILFFFCLNLNVYAASWRFEWENQIVKIPVNDSLNKYQNLPKARLYRNDILLTDTKITYNEQGDWLCYLADVNTSKVGEYEVWYKAYEEKYKPGTCNGYKCKVKFIVYDDKAPEIEILSDNIKIRRNTNFDPLKNVIVKDNYSKNVDVRYTSNMNYKKVGEYFINIVATDEFLNSSYASYTVNIYEDVYPSIVQLSDVVLELGSDADIKKYFKAYDEIDGDITNKICFPKIDTSKIGTYKYTISVLNDANLETKYEFDVKVSDNIMPSIILTKEKELLDYKTDFNTFDFKKYISSIIDNEKFNYDNLTIESNLENKIGNYDVVFKYNDGTYEVSKILNVELVSFDKPSINVSPIYVKVGEYTDLKKYIEVIDPSDDNCIDSLEIDTSDIDFYSIGKYIGHAYVINSSGMARSIDFEVNVVSNKDFDKLYSEIEVENETKYFDFKDIIYISIIGIFIGVIVIYVLKEKIIKKSKN